MTYVRRKHVSNEVPEIVVRYGPGILVQVFGAFLAAGLWLLVIFTGGRGPGAYFALLLLSGFFLVFLTFHESRFQIGSACLHRTWKFLGLIPIWKRRVATGKFIGVQQRFVPNHRAWKVGLLAKSGEFFPVQSFNPVRQDLAGEANAFALRLAELSKLPLAEVRTEGRVAFEVRPMPKLSWRVTLPVVIVYLCFTAWIEWTAFRTNRNWLMAVPFVFAITAGVFQFRRCPQCHRRLRSRRDPLGQTDYRIVYDCEDCHIRWDTGLIGDISEEDGGG